MPNMPLFLDRRKKLVQQNLNSQKTVVKRCFSIQITRPLREIFQDKKIHATPIGISKSAAKNVISGADKTTFETFGEKFTLPWGGEFFVGNALLALECVRELGAKPDELAKFLPTLLPLKRALKVKRLASGATILKDLYSANPDGVLGAIEHLGKFKGKKIFVGIPLRELGKEAEKNHEEIFHALKKIDAEIYWLKADFRDLGLKICGKKFHENDLEKLKKTTQDLGKDDAVLLESRLPEEVVKKFE